MDRRFSADAVPKGGVVVGTDFSDGSAVALAEGRRLAALLDSELTLVHVVDGLRPGDSGAAAWLRRTGVEEGELVVRHGSPWVELARYAGEVKPTLVVVGSHGESGYQPLSLGSTASRLTMHAQCPVVLVSPLARGGRRDRMASRESADARSRYGTGRYITTDGETR